MSLSFLETSARWTYGGFDDFRQKLATQIGLDLSCMDGYTKGTGKSWENITDPIVPLLNHSDMDDEISPSDCEQVAPRLQELVANWPDADDDKHQALLLAAGMEMCAKDNQPLHFI